jgi:hypothetical protein
VEAASTPSCGPLGSTLDSENCRIMILATIKSEGVGACKGTVSGAASGSTSKSGVRGEELCMAAYFCSWRVGLWVFFPSLLYLIIILESINSMSS